MSVVWTKVKVNGIIYSDYEISSDAEIRSYRKTGGRSGGTGRRSIPKLLTPQLSPQKYLIVKLYNEDGFKQYSLHRLVWNSFKGEIPERDENGEFLDVNHIDSVRWNCKLDNLEIIPHSKNVELSTIGEHQEKAICQYSLAGKLLAEYRSATTASKIIGVSRHSIGLCARGKTKTSGGFIWKFKGE